MSGQHSLRGRSRFTALRETGIDARADGIRLRLAPNGGASRAGFAVVGSRSAVQRNRLRRRLRAAIAPLLEGDPGRDVIVTAAATWADRPFSELVAVLNKAWSLGGKRLGVSTQATPQSGSSTENEGGSTLMSTALAAI